MDNDFLSTEGPHQKLMLGSFSQIQESWYCAWLWKRGDI